MLRVAPKGDVAHATSLPAEEDRILRAAFGRYGGQPEARAAAVPVVRHYQQLGAGSWFLCDCRSGAPRPPALVPVAQTYGGRGSLRIKFLESRPTASRGVESGAAIAVAPRLLNFPPIEDSLFSTTTFESDSHGTTPTRPVRRSASGRDRQ